MVAPYVGAWVEMLEMSQYELMAKVAPYAGAWVEISLTQLEATPLVPSHPMRVRGLKWEWQYDSCRIS